MQAMVIVIQAVSRPKDRMRFFITLTCLVVIGVKQNVSIRKHDGKSNRGAPLSGAINNTDNAKMGCPSRDAPTKLVTKLTRRLFMKAFGSTLYLFLSPRGPASLHGYS